MEIMGLRWSEVDFGSAQLLLPPERTKAGGHSGERRVQLSPAALTILSTRREAAIAAAKKVAKETKTDFVAPVYAFPAYRGDGHAIGLRKAFQAVTKRANQTGLRIHDLRHSFASALVADGATLHLVAKLLGHANTRVTERYAHLSNDPLQAAAARVSKRFGMAAPEPEADSEDGANEAPKGEVVAFPKKG